MKKIKQRLLKILELCFQPYMRILPGNVAFSLMISLIPIFSIIIMFCNSLNLSPSIIFERLGDVIPDNVLSMLIEYLSVNPWSNVIVLLAGIWAASSGPNAIIIASNMIYKNSNGNYIKMRIKASLLTLLLIFVIIINLLILVFGNNLLTFILNFFKINSNFLEIFKFIKWPISLIVVYTVIKILYTASPDKPIKSKTATNGTVFTTVTWLLVSAIYSSYVNNFANYTKVYGGLANIIILMIWLYILAYILMVGIAINAAEYNAQNKNSIKTKE